MLTATRTIAISLLLSLAALVTGCTLPAQIHWSPDGTRAVYVPTNGGAMILIDEKGAILQKLGDSHGGGAWSADSGTLYYAVATEPDHGAGKFELRKNWLATRAIEGGADPAAGPKRATIRMFRGGDSITLASLPTHVLHMRLSSSTSSAT